MLVSILGSGGTNRPRAWRLFERSGYLFMVRCHLRYPHVGAASNAAYSRGSCARRGRIGVDFDTEKSSGNRSHRPGGGGFDYSDPLRSLLNTLPRVLFSPRTFSRGISIVEALSTPDLRRAMQPDRRCSQRRIRRARVRSSWNAVSGYSSLYGLASCESSFSTSVQYLGTDSSTKE
jgi:hypothetical protein